MSTGSHDVPSVEQVPTCYRHPGRETYVRCQRCDRPICPDCMREAAVGFQCVECVRDGNRDVRRPRATFGGRVTAASRVTWTLVVVNVLMFAAEIFGGRQVIDQLGLYPPAVAQGEWWRLLSSAFLHATGGLPLHILFNMWALAVIGPQLERLLGRTRFAALYFLSALGGSVFGYFVEPLNSLSIGASGAIFGLFGAMFVVSRKLRFDTRWILFLIVINLVMTFTLPGIGWGAHVGGLITGLVISAAYVYAPARSRLAVHLASTGGIAVLLVVLVAVRTAQIHQMIYG